MEDSEFIFLSIKCFCLTLLLSGIKGTLTIFNSGTFYTLKVYFDLLSSQ